MAQQDRANVPLDAPIPGQSLTAPLGDRPWQKPARFSQPDVALAFYVDRITKEERANNMLDILENGVPVDVLVDIMQQGGVMEGVHSLDTGIIIAPALVEVISSMADNVGIEYTKFSTGTKDKSATSAEIVFATKDEPQAEVPEIEVEEDIEEEPKGLMARRAK
jgi:hypothetical protein|tara:strand:- start:2084 stop:2575 length:492 start_codon:yes stop_codon:yes gene_type:complete